MTLRGGDGGGLIRRRGLETSSTCLGASRQTRGSCLSTGELPEGARGVGSPIKMFWLYKVFVGIKGTKKLQVMFKPIPFAVL